MGQPTTPASLSSLAERLSGKRNVRHVDKDVPAQLSRSQFKHCSGGCWADSRHSLGARRDRASGARGFGTAYPVVVIGCRLDQQTDFVLVDRKSKSIRLSELHCWRHVRIWSVSFGTPGQRASVRRYLSCEILEAPAHPYLEPSSGNIRQKGKKC